MSFWDYVHGGGNKPLPPVPHQPTTPEFWFAPNVGSDLIGLVQRRDDWRDARAITKPTHLQVYSQNLYPDFTDNTNDLGPNSYTSLLDRGFFAALAEMGLQLAVEAGVVKHWWEYSGCDGRATADFMLRAIEQMNRDGITLDAVTWDEPLMSRTDCKHTHESIVEPICHATRTLRAAGVPHIGLTEAWRASTPTELIQLVDRVQQAGEHLEWLHLEVDLASLNDQKLSRQQRRDEMQMLQQSCRDRQITLGIIVGGQRPTSDQEFHDTSLFEAQEVRDYLGYWPNRMIPQSCWRYGANDTGTRDVPVNLPDSNPTTLTHLLKAGGELVAAHP